MELEKGVKAKPAGKHILLAGRFIPFAATEGPTGTRGQTPSAAQYGTLQSPTSILSVSDRQHSELTCAEFTANDPSRAVEAAPQLSEIWQWSSWTR
jgi:hypothetical protein